MIGTDGNEAPPQLHTIAITHTMQNDLFNWASKEAKRLGLLNVQAYLNFLAAAEKNKAEKKVF